MNRRDFAAITAGAFVASRARLEAQVTPANAPLDIAEYSYFWVGVEHAKLARGTICNGMQMYVEYWIPKQIKHQYSMVLVHGGNGQGTDWMGTPDGRRGWATYLLLEGYRVYIVDRPGQGRPPYHPDLNGIFDPQAPTYEKLREYAGPGKFDEPSLDQIIAAQGPAMVNNAITQSMWRSRGALLVDQIGPSILMTHGDSSAFALLTADERPALVKGIVAIEPPAPVNQQIAKAPLNLNRIGSIPIAVVSNDSSTTAILKNARCNADQIRLSDHGIQNAGPYMMMEKNNREALNPILDWIDSKMIIVTSPSEVKKEVRNELDSTALKLKDQGFFWTGVQRKKMSYGTIAAGQMFVQYMIPEDRRYQHPVVLVHGGGGQGTHMMGIGRRPGWVQYFLQEGYAVYCLDRPGFGRSPYHPDALGPSYLRNFPDYESLITSIAVFNTAQWPGPGGMNDPLIDQFMANEVGRVGDEAAHSETTAEAGAQLLDKIGPAILVTTAFGGFFGWVVADRRPNLVKGIMCMEGNGIPFAGAFKWGLTATPMTYEPPVKDASALKLADTTLPADSPLPIVPSYKIQAEPAHQLKNLKNIPIGWLTGEFGGGGNGIAQVNFLKQAGCSAELLRLRDLGIIGNGNLMQMEKNNRQVFEVIRDWLDRKVAKPLHA